MQTDIIVVIIKEFIAVIYLFFLFSLSLSLSLSFKEKQCLIKGIPIQ